MKPLTVHDLTEEQLKSATVRFAFADGTSDSLDAKVIKDTCDRQVLDLRRIQGGEGGRPTKAQPDIETVILTKFTEYWLNRNETYPLLQAYAHARAWIVKEILDKHRNIDETTARRWVAKVIGKKKAAPKKYPRK